MMFSFNGNQSYTPHTRRGGPVWDWIDFLPASDESWQGGMIQWCRGDGAGHTVVAAFPDVSPLTLATELEEMADLVRSSWIKRQRREGQSWAAVADALGTSRQAAWERYKHLDED